MKRLLLAVLLAFPFSAAWPRGGGGGGGGGCFPAGTIIQTTAGGLPIENIRADDKVLAFSNDRLVQVAVKNVYEKKDRLLVIRTAKNKLTTTSEHPLMTRDGFTQARDLKKGTEVAVLSEGRRVWTKIKSIKPGGVSTVYNLEVAPPHTFIADSFIVHNKGGGFSGGGYYHSSGYYDSDGLYHSRSNSTEDYFLFALIGTVLLIKGISFFSERSSSYAPKSRVLDDGEVAPRAEATLVILKSLARRAPEFNPDELESFTRDVFTRVQLAWQARDYSTLGSVMMPDILAEHNARIENMKQRHEVNMMDDLKVLRIDFVHVRCPQENEGRAYTALIKASARDYTIDENSDPTAAAGAEVSTFQEFWTFYRCNGNWALARIDQTGDLDILNAPNLPDKPESAPASGYTAGLAAGLAASAAAFAPAAGPAPAAPPAEDKWNRQKMEIAATLAFGSVYAAWGGNDASLLSTEFVSAEALARLKKIMEARKAEGFTFEFGSLFTRRAEVVLTSPAEKNDPHLDEFTARITGTAVRAMLRNGKALHRDEAPHLFTEYWVFVRQGGEWKLRDILPRMDQDNPAGAQDGEPSPVQIEWYWET